MSDRICYIHAGTGKTGTTAIQYELTMAGDYLASHGLAYPDFSGNLTAASGGKPTAGNGRLLFGLLSRGKVEKALSIVNEHARDSDKFVISNEGFCSLPADILGAFNDGLIEFGFRTKCCVCYRPQADFVVSYYLQALKANKIDWRESVDDFAARSIEEGTFIKKWGWLNNADKLAKVFGGEQLLVLWYPALMEKGPNAVARAIFDWLELPGHEDWRPLASNPSPNPEAMHVLRMLNGIGLGGRKFADDFLSHAHERGLLTGRVRLSAKVRKRVEAVTRKSNQLLLEKYAVDGALAEDKMLSAAVPETSDVRREVFAELLGLTGWILGARGVQLASTRVPGKRNKS